MLSYDYLIEYKKLSPDDTAEIILIIYAWYFFMPQDRMTI